MRTSALLKIGAVIISGLFLAGAAYAVGGASFDAADRAGGNPADAGDQGNRIRISYPEKNSVISGYFLPVSWRDAEVESEALPYPDNYKASQRFYRVMLLDGSDVVLEKVVTGLNYYIFTINETKDVLEKKAYRFRVETLGAVSAALPVRFFYEKPDLDDAILEELKISPPSSGEDAPASEQEDGQFTSLDNAYAALDTSSYSSCPTCYSHYWPGMVVFYIRSPTTYAKTLNIYCGPYQYYEKILDPSFSGPVFTSMMSGYNYNAIYNDRFILSNRCINIAPFEYTWVLFP